MFRTRYRFALTAALLLFAIPTASPYSDGAPDGYAGNPPGNLDCTACHTTFPANSGSGGTNLLQMPGTFTPSLAYPVGVLVGHTGQSIWGFQLTALDSNGQSAGVFFPASEDSVSIRVSEYSNGQPDYVNQTAEGTLAGRSFGLWNFFWLAPPPGTGPVDFYIASLAGDGDGTEEGDYVYTMVRHVEMLDGGVDGPRLYVPWPSHSFGTTPLNTTRTHTFALHNAGNEPLVLSAATFGGTGMFSLVEPAPDTVAPASHVELTVAFTPTVESVFTDSLVLVSNSVDTSAFVYTLFGRGTQPLPPDPFDLITPTDGAHVASDSVTFRWQSTTNRDSLDPTVDFLLQIDTESDFRTAADYATGSDTTLTLARDHFQVGRLYFWRVYAPDSNTAGTYSSSSRAFFVDPLSGVEDDGAKTLPRTWAVTRVYPNPFNASVTIDVTSPGAGSLSLDVFDLLGRHVATLHRGPLAAGNHAFAWTPSTASGLYLLRASAPGYHAVRKLVVLR